MFDSALILDYVPIIVFFGITILIGVLVSILPRIFAKNKYKEDKLKAYECGFDAFTETRNKFDIRFYLVAILFVIFDLEIAFLIPWATKLAKIGQFGFWSMIVFLLLLIIGFIYEWKSGALDW